MPDRVEICQSVGSYIRLCIWNCRWSGSSIFRGTCCGLHMDSGTGSGSNSDRIKYMEEKSGRFLVMLADDSTGGSPSSETGQCDSVGSLYRCRSACSSSLYLVFKHCYDFCHFHFWRYGYRKLYLLSDSCKYEMDPYCIMHSGSGTRSVDSDAHGIG